MASSSSSAYQSIDKVIAIIGDDIIFSTELDRRLAQAKVRAEARGRSINLANAKEQILEGLISERLQLNLAQRNNIRTTEAEVESAIARTKTRLEENAVSFDNYLSAQGLTLSDAKKELEKELIIDKIQQGVINQRINISKREIDNFLVSKAGKEWLETRYQLGHILLSTNTISQEKALSQANSLYESLKDPNTEFKKIAARYSKGPNASKGGDLGTKKKAELPELFVQQVESIAIGEITQPFTSNAGVHILKLYQKQGAESILVEQNHVRHLLIKVSELVTDDEAQDKINQLYQRILNGEDLATLANEHTEDIGSKLNGGDLGWSNPGQFVPEFEKIVNQSSIGELSQPFKSTFGWHILRVEDRRTQDMLETVKRNQVGKLLRQQRFQDELQIWLKELRSNAYVEILI